MYTNLIVTVGTSLLASFNQFGKLAREQNGFQFNGRALEQISAGFVEEDVLEYWLTSIRQYIHNNNNNNKVDLHSICAETSAIHLLNRTQKIVKGATVHLYYTSSLEGRICSRTIQLIIETKLSLHVELHELHQFNIKNVVETEQAMGRYLIDVCNRLKALEGKAAFIPIGGYKVITSISYIAAAITQTKMFYIPEGGKKLHPLPLLPVNLTNNRNLLIILNKIEKANGYSFEELNLEEQKILEEYPNFTLLVDDQIYLNAIGFYLTSMKRWYGI